MSLKFLGKEFLNNQIADYLHALTILVIVSLIVRLLSEFISRLLRKWANNTQTILDDILIEILENRSISLLYLCCFYLAINNSALPPRLG